MIGDGLLKGLDALLAGADAAAAARPDADAAARRAARQPVHTVYVPADRYGPSTVTEWGAAARAVLDAYADDPELPATLGIAPALLREVVRRVEAKLAVDPVEDVRVDFEDGYGTRPDAEEDAAATAAGAALAATRRSTAHGGLRIKCLEAPTRARAVRTLARFVAAYAEGGGDLTDLLVTVPKVSAPEQVAAAALVCDRLEAAQGVYRRALRLELQVELPAAVVAPDGTVPLARMVAAAGGRCAGLHYGTYDYSAALGIAPGEQRADHPAAEHAKAVMQVVAAGAGVAVVDGSSNVLPVGERADVLTAWAAQARVVRRALSWGIGQGWDLHPAQLPCRYLVTFAFLREGAPAARARLAAYRARSAAGGLDGRVLDEPATERALTAYLARGVRCGALDPDEGKE